MPAYPEYSSLAPGIFVRQTLENGVQVSEPALPACLVGPAKLLSRYGQETPVATAFTGGEQVLPWKAKINDVDTVLGSGYLADFASARLYMRDGEVSLATILAADTPSFRINSASEPNVLKLTSGAVAGTSLLAAFRGRDVKVGDVVYCRGSDGGTLRKRTITALRGVTGAGTFGQNNAGTDEDAGNSSSNPVTTTASATQVSAPAGGTISCANPEDFNGLALGARYLTQYGERFIVTVHTAGAPGVGKVNIASVSAKFQATNVATVDDAGSFSITDVAGSGVDFLLTAAGGSLVVGQTWIIDVVGAYERIDTTQLVLSGAYTGARDTTYLIEVVTTNSAGTSFTGAQVRVTDTAGIDVSGELITITDNTNFDLGSFGIQAKFYGAGNMPAQAGLLVGDRYYVHAKAGSVSTTSFDKIVLNGPAVDSGFDPDTDLFSVELRQTYTGEIARDGASDLTAWDADAEALTVEAGLQLYVEERDSGYQWCNFVANVGYLVPSFSAFIKTGALTMQAITTSNVATVCGSADFANPLGSAARAALSGADGVAVYVVNTGGDQLSDFEAALNAIRNNRTPYELVILSEDREVWTAVKAHVVEASGVERLLMRRARMPVTLPGRYGLLTARADTTNFTATITEYNGEYRLVTLVAGASEASLLSLELAGDGLLWHAGNFFPIESIISDTELLLAGSGAPGAVDPAEAIQIWREDTVASQKAYLRDAAASMQDRRITLNWCDGGRALVGGQSTLVPMTSAAAYLAGVRSATPPQIGMTGQTIAVIETAAPMHSRWSIDDIKEITSYGIQVLHQEDPSAAIAVYDQVTTDTQNGYLEFQENTTPRLDLISRQLRALVVAKRGKTNATDATADQLRADILSLLVTLRRRNLNQDYGPVIDDYDAPVTQVSPLLLNQIDAYVRVAIGPPANRFWFELVGAPRITTV